MLVRHRPSGATTLRNWHRTIVLHRICTTAAIGPVHPVKIMRAAAKSMRWHVPYVAWPVRKAVSASSSSATENASTFCHFRVSIFSDLASAATATKYAIIVRKMVMCTYSITSL